MPKIIGVFLIVVALYNYFWYILSITIFVGLVLGFYSIFIAPTSSQDAQPVRMPVPPRPTIKTLVNDEPLDDLTDEEPPHNAVVEEVTDALENEFARKAGKYGEEQVNIILRQISMDYLSDVYLEDNQGLTQIDHIAKFSWGFLVIETKNYGGFISATRNPFKWKQSFRHFGSQKYYLFQNPICQNERHIRAVKYITGLDKNIVPMVVFAGKARTSKNVHEQIVRIRKLKSTVRDRPEVNYINSWKRDQAWEKLKQHTNANIGRGNEHLEHLRRKGF